MRIKVTVREGGLCLHTMSAFQMDSVYSVSLNVIGDVARTLWCRTDHWRIQESFFFLGGGAFWQRDQSWGIPKTKKTPRIWGAIFGRTEIHFSKKKLSDLPPATIIFWDSEQNFEILNKKKTPKIDYLATLVTQGWRNDSKGGED